MAFLSNPAKLQELTGDAPLSGDSSTITANTLKQVDRLINFLREEGKVSEDDAKKIIVASIAAEADKRGGDQRDVYNSYPQAVRNKLFYTLDDLEKNQQVTVLGLKVSVAVFIGSFIAALVAAAAAFKYAKLLPPFLRIPVQVAVPAIVAAFLTRIGWTISTMTNNWNDVFHWGPINVAQQLSQLSKGIPGAGFPGAGVPSERKPVTRITMAKTQKPTLLLGTIYTQRIGDLKTFDRLLDDKITDSSDLRADAQANLNRFLLSMPGRMQIRLILANNPIDELGVRHTGTWMTMAITYLNLTGKAAFLDTILLGPVDPVVYMPKFQEIQTIQVEIPKLLTAEEIAEVEFPSEGVKIVDKTGTIVPAPFGPSKPVVSEALPPLAPPAGIGPAGPVSEALPPLAPPAGFGPAFIPPAPALPPPQVIPATIPLPAASPARLGLPKPAIIRANVASTAVPHLNIRESPGVFGRDIGDLLPGTRVDAVENFTSFMDGFTWQKVRVFPTGQIGYVALEFLT